MCFAKSNESGVAVDYSIGLTCAAAHLIQVDIDSSQRQGLASWRIGTNRSKLLCECARELDRVIARREVRIFHLYDSPYSILCIHSSRICKSRSACHSKAEAASELAK